jgi:hypothetical protein
MGIMRRTAALVIASCAIMRALISKAAAKQAAVLITVFLAIDYVIRSQ